MKPQIKMNKAYEHPSLEDNPMELSDTRLSVEKVLGELTDKYTGSGITGVEKGRGAVIPIGAVGATSAAVTGVKIAAQLEPTAQKVKTVAEAAASIGIGTGSAIGAANAIEKAASLLPMISAVPGPLIAGTTSLVGSGAVSLFQRLMGENAFKLYAKYSHIEEGSNLADKVDLVNPLAGTVIRKGMWVGKQFARGAERAVLNIPELGGIVEMNDYVKEFVDNSSLDSFYEQNNVKDLIGEGFYYLLTANATKYFGAYFSPEELQAIKENSQRVTQALEKVLNDPKLYEAQTPDEVYEALESSIARIEAWNYFKEAAAVSVISGAKGAMMYGLIELVFKAIEGIKLGGLPGITPKGDAPTNLTQQPAQAPAYSFQHNDATVPVPDSVYQPVPKLGPENQPTPSPLPFPSPWPKRTPQGVPQPALQPVPEGIPQTVPQPVFEPQPYMANQPIPEASPSPVITVPLVRPGRQYIPDQGISDASPVPNIPITPAIPKGKHFIPDQGISELPQTVPSFTPSNPSINLEHVPNMAIQPGISASGVSGAKTIESSLPAASQLPAVGFPSTTGETVIPLFPSQTPAISATGISSAQTLESALPSLSSLPALTTEQWAMISPANIPAATAETIIKDVVVQNIREPSAAAQIASDATAAWHAGGGVNLLQTLRDANQFIGPYISWKVLGQLGMCALKRGMCPVPITP